MSTENVWRGKIRADWAYKPYHDLDRVIPGDVIRLSGRLRKVRRVTRLPGTDHVHSISVLKVRRSGYPAPDTVIGRSSIVSRGGYRWQGIVGHTELCTTELECAVQREIENRTVPYRRPEITERQTVGVLR